MLDSVHVDADGSAGGLISIWRSDFFKLVSSCYSRFFCSHKWSHSQFLGDVLARFEEL